MHFSEDDLKEALRRKDPGPGFTQRVIARIGQEEPQAAGKTTTIKLPWWRAAWRSYPALAGALGVLVLIIGGGLGYQQYQHIQAQRRAEAQKAELAKQKVVEALRITNATLGHVFRRVSEPSVGEPKIRRQTL
ncbi:MAG TPA: anti-sigma factor [Terriglobales bacterium]